MARSLHNKSNVEAPSSDYPYGRIKDKVANLTAGTPVNEAVYGDFHQFFSRLMAEAGIEENGNPDNDYTGFQLYQALLKTIAKKIGQYSSEDDLTPSSPTSLDSFIYPGIFNVDPYTLENDPGLDGPGQLVVGGNPDISVVQRLIDLTNGAEWKRTWSLASGFGGWVLIRLATRRYNIGEWDCDTEVSVTINLGFQGTRVKSVKGLVYSDITAGAFTISDLISGAYVQLNNTGVNVNNLVLLIIVSGIFDGTGYNEKNGYNRGIITVEYDPSF